MALSRALWRVRLLVPNDNLLFSKCLPFVNNTSISQCSYEVNRQFKTNSFTINSVLRKDFGKETKDQKHQTRLACTSSSSDNEESSSSDSESDDNDVTIEYNRGLPQITVPLPSRREKCRFTLKPISNTVGDFFRMIQFEDRGVDRITCTSRDGTRIAAATSIETLLSEDFRLTINDRSYNVDSPKQERLTSEEVQTLNDVKALISQLYEALNVKDHQIEKELQLSTELETLQQQILPLEEQKMELDLVADKRSNWMAWAGLGYMATQFGILARLTWWEYSWDIMEPVTYFVTYGTAMAAYGYFLCTREEYILNEVRDRSHLKVLHKKAKKIGFDVTQYNLLRDEIAKRQFDLKRLRDPLKLRLPKRTEETPAAEGECQDKSGQVVKVLSNALQRD